MRSAFQIKYQENKIAESEVIRNQTFYSNLLIDCHGFAVNNMLSKQVDSITYER